jgi:DnaJ-domain-containing protein 1
MEAGAPWFAMTDGIRLAMLRESLEERARLMTHAEASTETRKALRDINREISDWLTALGFDPSARARLGLAEVKAQSELEKMQNKRDTKKP